MRIAVHLWLDDVRDPRDHGAIGYTWVTTIADAKRALEVGDVVRASLDHDLGACAECLQGRTVEEWIATTASMPHCPHVGTGYDLCVWMAETGHWPEWKPRVHSMNPDGARRMRGVIDRYFPQED